jgi:hypothetical protein
LPDTPGRTAMRPVLANLFVGALLVLCGCGSSSSSDPAENVPATLPARAVPYLANPTYLAVLAHGVTVSRLAARVPACSRRPPALDDCRNARANALHERFLAGGHAGEAGQTELRPRAHQHALAGQRVADPEVIIA